MPDCDGCINEGAYKRGSWNVCVTCRAEYDQRRQEARSHLLLPQLTPDAHLWRISGAAWGDVSCDDFGEMQPFTLKRPVLVESCCRWCAIRLAFLTLDPWAFESHFSLHGDDIAHDPEDLQSYLVWNVDRSKVDDSVTLVVEDLGEVPQYRWGQRFSWPALFGKQSAASYGHSILTAPLLQLATKQVAD